MMGYYKDRQANRVSRALEESEEVFGIKGKKK